jgi:hypothetical protein
MLETTPPLPPLETTPPVPPLETTPSLPPLETGSEVAARQALRDQIARLDAELSELAASGAPVADAARRRRRGPRILALEELEGVRDELVERAACARRALDERGKTQELKRRALEELTLDPGQHRFVHISREEIGEPGCGTWHARPRLGLLGMLMNWWRVKISSGCPLPGAKLVPPGRVAPLT